MRSYFRIFLPLFATLIAPTNAWEASLSQNFPITIVATTPTISFNPPSLTFASQKTGTSSSPQTITMTNTGTASFSLSSIGIIGTNAGDFSETNDCPAPLAVNASCHIDVTFTPIAAGASTASSVAFANGGGSYTAALSGTGVSGGGAVSAAFFGMHIDAAADWPQSPTIIGSRGKCSGVTWPYLETSRGVYSWGGLDYCLSTAQAHKVTNFFSSDCTNGSLCTAGIPNWTSCSNLATDYQAFFQAMVNRYGAQLIYELWNEPETAVSGYGGNCSVSQFVSAINAADTVVRTTAPAATILAPSFGPSLMHAFYAAGGTQNVDGWTVHIYTNPNPSPGQPENLLSMLAFSVTEMAKWPTANAKPIWMTEGDSYANYNGSGIPADSVKAAYIARYYLLLWAENVQYTYWYEWDNVTFGVTMGYPVAITAFDQTENWMIGSSNPILAVHGTVYTVNMTLASGAAAQAVWNTAGSVSYAVPGGYGHYKNLAGNTNAIVGGAVTIGVQPILLTP